MTPTRVGARQKSSKGIHGGLPGSPMVRGCCQSLVGGSAGTLAYPRSSHCRGPNPATLAGFTNTLPEPRKNAERIGAIKKQSAPRKTRCCGGACVLIALSLVAILATLGAPIAMFDGVSPNSLAPVRNDPQNRPFQKARRFATRWVRSPAPSGVPASASPCPGCRPRHRRGCRGLNPTRTPTSSTV